MKDAYYFQHDANARHDPKLLMLNKECGMEGIGRWWCLVEILREQEDYAFDISETHNLKALRYELNFENEEGLTTFLNTLVELCLIRRFEGKIISHALMKRMHRLDEIKEKRREAGIKSGESRKALSEQKGTNVQHRSNTVQHLQQNREHIPTYSPSESRSDSPTQPPTHKQTHPATKSVQYAEAVPQAGMYAQHAPTASNDNSHLREPDTDNVYIYPSAYKELPVGAYFVPSDAKANTQQVLLKLSNDEAMTVKEKRTVRVLEQEHIVYSHLDYSQVSTIIQ
jgi:Domain of unknown function (DUF4373)